MFSTYQLKPKLEQSLRPLAQQLVNRGLTANRVTLIAAAGSVVVGALLALFSQTAGLFWLLPLWLVVRLLLDLLDGLMAREFMQESAQGAYLSESAALLAEAALFLPFAFVAPLGGLAVGLLIWLAALSESIGLLGKVHGFHGRRHDGPMGNSDRAVVLAVLAVWYAASGSLNWAAAALLWLTIAATAYTCWLRWQNGLKAYPVDNDNE